jgi:hypothetical protein
VNSDTLAYDREDVRGLVSDVVDGPAAFGALGVTRDDVLRDALQFILGEGYDGLWGLVSRAGKMYARAKRTFSSLKFFCINRQYDAARGTRSAHSR